MLSGLIGPNNSSGFRVDCAWRAWRSSGDSAHWGRLKSGDRSESSESEYLLVSVVSRWDCKVVELTLKRYRAERYLRFAFPKPFRPIVIGAGPCFAAAPPGTQGKLSPSGTAVAGTLGAGVVTVKKDGKADRVLLLAEQG